MTNNKHGLSRAQKIAEARRSLSSGSAKALREASGLSQSDVARAIGVHSSVVSRWESGQRSPAPDAAVRLARLLARLEAHQ